MRQDRRAEEDGALHRCCRGDSIDRRKRKYENCYNGRCCFQPSLPALCFFGDSFQYQLGPNTL